MPAKTLRSVRAMTLAALAVISVACTTSGPIFPVQSESTPNVEGTVEASLQATVEALPATATPALPTPAMTIPPTASPTATMTPAPTVPPSPTAIPPSLAKPSPQGPTEAALKIRAEEALAALSNEQWLDYYEFLRPAARESCSAREFAAQMGVVFSLIKGLVGAQAGEHLEFRLGDVKVNGDKGSNKTNLLFKGEPLEFGADMSSDDEWVFIDGQWWIEVGDACEGFGL